MVEQHSEVSQYIVVERPDSHGETKEIWRGELADFRRRTRYLKTADVSAVIEKDCKQVRKISLNVARRLHGLNPA